ncbi:GNAT family N-acetyltransferase [Microbacter margulisiae]|uniref:RimJ/RimL family protein N-acetyltransferase n=1 Tax=Microbacter margulisiae TaxID=1350067 RepID=A0A7W5DNS2_9PORP|nr:GNAT family N-acetyltransferase [Microbacter margulisiae]MBB3186000.1 RimJ/RimL family protein N-acetyltransferase [Microbacter margulisiae]
MELKSKTIFLRLVEQSDAEFILSLRINNNYSKYLSRVDDNLSEQERWLADYKKREALEQEFYFIICRNSDSLPIGTVRIYDFIGDRESFSWGSWILNENKTRYAALECALLIYDFAFFTLGFKRCHMDIRKQNIKVIEFHKKFGVKMIGETEIDLLGHYFPEDYLSIREKINTMIESYDKIS